jgi:DNA end-binding protein Ku
MTARAIWTGVILLDEEKVPVKLYSAAVERNVHFRMLHRKDRVPVRQRLINPETERAVDFSEARRAYATKTGELVLLDKQELETLAPKSSRDIEILYFVDAEQIDHRLYDRPYYLGPNADEDAWQALAAALEGHGKSGPVAGLARWTMRNKCYNGALQLYQGYPMLITLRNAEEVVPVDALKPPAGKELDAKELAMARQLIGMLEAPFEPEAYRDEYRDRVLELVESKQEGVELELAPPRRIKPDSGDLARALEASLEKLRKTA